ncbi:beta-glucoside-specific PTS transporter subunit IIABC [Lacrimispora sp.]|uniref:beta-glucoside-specific PTS transporter subunit IIABC n=1 Tax=Lacrimispora sp. TaxID=2719234 RepID=UPI0032E487ED
MNDKNLAEKIVQNIGGKENVKSLTHCMTRLRFVLKNEQKADKEALEKLDIMQVVRGGGQYQIVIGTNVKDVYDEVIKLTGDVDGGKDDRDGKEQKLSAKIFNVISGSFTPIIPAILGSGMLKALLQILVAAGVMQSTSGTYAILTAASNAVFYFLPIILGITFGTRMNVNPYISGVIGAALLEPNYTRLLTSAGGRTDFLHIPVVLMDYSSTVFPVILAICTYVLIDRLLKKIIPGVFQVLFVPMLSLMLVVPITLIVFGPFGIYTGTFISNVLTFALGKNAVLTNIVFGFIGIPTVMLGLHWALIPVIINNLSTTGQDFLLPTVQATAYAGAGAALGVFFKTKDIKLKELSFSAFVPAFLTGITEPVIYGIFFKFRRVLFYAMSMSAVAGGLCGIFHISASQLAGGIMVIPSYNPAVSFAIAMAVAFAGTFLLTYVFGYESVGKSAPTPVDMDSTKLDLTVQRTMIAPAKGTVVQLDQVSDEVFSSGTLGKGIGVIPDSDEIFAPADGTVVTVFTTRHAIGIRTDYGAEMIIHIGINTVELKGKYFDIRVKEGDKITSGQVIGNVEFDKVKEAGYDTTVMLIVTNTDHFREVKIMEPDSFQDPVIQVE